MPTARRPAVPVIGSVAAPGFGRNEDHSSEGNIVIWEDDRCRGGATDWVQFLDVVSPRAGWAHRRCRGRDIIRRLMVLRYRKRGDIWRRLVRIDRRNRSRRPVDGLAGPWWAGVCRDEGVNGSQGRQKRPVLDALLKGVACREFEIVAAWLVCRLGQYAEWPDRFAGLSYRPRDDRVMAGLNRTRLSGKRLGRESKRNSRAIPAKPKVCGDSSPLYPSHHLHRRSIRWLT